MPSWSLSEKRYLTWQALFLRFLHAKVKIKCSFYIIAGCLWTKRAQEFESNRQHGNQRWKTKYLQEVIGLR